MSSAYHFGRNCNNESGSTGLAVRKATLYSRSRRPPPQPPAATAVAPAEPKKPSRLRAWIAAHRATVYFAAGAVLSAFLLVGFMARPAPQRPLTQEDIDAAVLHTLENEAAAVARGARPTSVIQRRRSCACAASASRRGRRRTIERSVGTGVVIVDNGIILTNLHVVARRRSGSRSSSSTARSPKRPSSACSPSTTSRCCRRRRCRTTSPPATLRSTGDLRAGRRSRRGRLSVRHRPVGLGRRHLGPEARVPLARRQAPAHQPHPVRRRGQSRQLRRAARHRRRRSGRHRHRHPQSDRAARVHRHRLRRADRERGRGGRHVAVLSQPHSTGPQTHGDIDEHEPRAKSPR